MSRLRVPVAGPAATVTIAGFAFQPATLTVSVGTTLTWTINDSAAHTATSNTGVWNSGNLAQGASYSFTFNTPGTHNYHCALHPSMEGTIVVSNGPTPTPTAAPIETATVTPTATSTSVPTTTATPAVAATTTATPRPGNAWAWGGNGSGQLGDGTTTNRATPAQVSGHGGVVAIAAGGSHSLAVQAGTHVLRNLGGGGPGKVD